GYFHDAVRFELVDTFNRFPHLRAHSHQHTEHRRTCGIQTDAANEKVATGLRRRGDEPVGSGGKIAWNAEVARFGDLIAENRDRSVLLARRAHEKIPQHALGVIARLRLLDD